MKLIKSRYYLFIALIGIVAFTLGAIFDKQVSEALYVNSNMRGIGLIVSNFALVPFFLAACTAGILGTMILIKDGKRYHTAFRVIFCIIFIGAVGFCLFQAYDKIKDIRDVYGKTAGLISGIATAVIVLGLAFLFAYLMFKKYDHAYTFKLIIAFLVIYLVSLVIAEAIKYLWSRPRPLYVFGASGIPSHLAEFRNVWEPQPFAAFKSGYGDFFKSFPSNHVNTGTMVFTALLLYSKLNKKLDNELARSLILLCAFLFSILIGLNRIICGMHYLSDVSFGFLITFTVTYFGFISLNRINKQYHFFDEEVAE